MDFSTAESQVSSDELNVLIIKNNYENKILVVKDLLNIPFEDSIVLEKPQISLITKVDTMEIKSINSPHKLLATINVEKSKLELTASKNGYYPSISVSSGYGTNYSSEREGFLFGTRMPFGDQ